MDPFFVELRRRHPDIDIVLLPPQPRQPPSVQPDDETEAAVVEALAHVVTRSPR